MKILAVIPARSGSKAIPHKNIKSLFGKPLMAYSIEHARGSELINRAIVSTDSEYYAEIAKSFGAEAPFIRPVEISQDDSNDYDLFDHTLNWFKMNEKYVPDICVQLRPTHPIRRIKDIDSMIQLLIKRPDADSVRSVVENKATIPYKMWFINDEQELTSLMQNTGIREHYNQPRQQLPRTYFQNASVDVIRTKTIIEKKSLSGDKILGYIMDEEYDIDYEKDFDRIKSKLLYDDNKRKGKKRYCIDIDGIIAQLSPGNNYNLAEPNIENILKINRLFDQGNEIILFTARGSKTGMNWEDLTSAQLKTWGVRYHELRFGKPAADYYIDDRNLNINEIK